MKKAPLLSVVMSVYNGEEYLHEALNSILAQTFQDFECIVINDGSTDRTAEILNSHSDNRLVILNQENKGLVASLNRGLKSARGEYIARHDADDRSLPERFELQTNFLNTHKDVVIVGSSIAVMNESGVATHEHHVLLHDPELRQELLIRSPFAHGSVMFRRSALKSAGLYNADFWPAEDYEFWLRLSSTGKLANIDTCLYVYRENAAGISAKNKHLQAEAVLSTQAAAWGQRSRLVRGKKISFSSYKNIPDGKARINRILANISKIHKTAQLPSDALFRLKNLSLIASNPVAYRRIAGTIKRKLKRH